MKRYAPLILTVSALSLGIFLFVGDDSYTNLRAMRKKLEVEREKNDHLAAHVEQLRRQIRGLSKDDRFLEQTARNELGLARPNELIVVFEESPALSTSPPK